MATAPCPRDDFARYLRSFPDEMAFSDDEPATVLDRYCVAEFEQWSDGLRLDRDRLIAHAQPARRNVVSADVDVHDVLVVDNRVAARYTLSAAMRTGRRVTIEVYLLGVFAEDGRLRRIDQITRTVPPDTS